jgi:GrpB-like predicted nucleotidyltransferase (UPF0157 family)
MNKLGVEKGKVKIEKYNSSWKNEFKTEQIFLSEIFNIPLESIIHFGSTSIPLCSSKPIIDIAIPIETIKDFNLFSKKLNETEYIINNIYFLHDRICLTKGNPQTHHLYFVLKNSLTFLNWMTFKNVLSKDLNLVFEYSNLKESLLLDYSNSRIEYTEAKTKFILSILNSQEKWKQKITSIKK